MSAAQSQPIAITPDDIRTVKLLSLVRHLSHNATISLTETVENASRSDLSPQEKRQMLYECFERGRAQFARMSILTSWATNHDIHVSKILAELRRAIDERTRTSSMGDRLLEIHNSTFERQKLAYDVDNAMDVLASGRMLSFPTSIGKVFRPVGVIPESVTPTLIQDAVTRLTGILRSRMMQCAAPEGVSRITVDRGRIIMVANGLYSIKLTLSSVGSDARWRIIDPVTLLVASAKASSAQSALSADQKGDDAMSEGSSAVGSTIASETQSKRYWSPQYSRELETYVNDNLPPAQAKSGPALWSAVLDTVHGTLVTVCLRFALEILAKQAHGLALRTSVRNVVIARLPDFRINDPRAWVLALVYWVDLPRLSSDDAVAHTDTRENRRYGGLLRIVPEQRNLRVFHTPDLPDTELYVDMGAVDLPALLFYAMKRHAQTRLKRVADLLAKLGLQVTSKLQSRVTSRDVSDGDVAMRDVQESHGADAVYISFDISSCWDDAIVNGPSGTLHNEGDQLNGFVKKAAKTRVVVLRLDARSGLLTASAVERSVEIRIPWFDEYCSRQVEDVFDLSKLMRYVHVRLALEDVMRGLQTIGTSVAFIDEPDRRGGSSAPLSWLPSSDVPRPFLLVSGKLAISFLFRGKWEPRISLFAVQPPIAGRPYQAQLVPPAYSSIARLASLAGVSVGDRLTLARSIAYLASQDLIF